MVRCRVWRSAASRSGADNSSPGWKLGAPGGTVTIAETRISILAFQGERVYKLNKAVRFPFIDLSTAARRLEDCRRELALNRRIAPTSTSASTP
jgi:hypothetical protein